ncbi:hypothetical protein AB0H88_40000 [Nonomuraea sp. NPDC050680]
MPAPCGSPSCPARRPLPAPLGAAVLLGYALIAATIAVAAPLLQDIT